jgi:hypothetical protein
LKFLCSQVGADWVDVTGKSPMPALSPEQQAAESTLTHTLEQILNSDNLIILAGLGCSLHVHGKDPAKAGPRMSDLWESVKAAAGDKFQKAANLAGFDLDHNQPNIELLLSRCQLYLALNDASTEVSAFIDVAEKAIVERCTFLDETANLDVHGTLLRKIARRSMKKARPKIFTVNYDLCFETAASRARFTVLDGFSFTEPREFDGSYFDFDIVRRTEDRDIPQFIESAVQLFKLHGSLDWEKKGSQVVKSDKPTKPIIIFPRNTKYEASYDQPFLELMSRFQSTLRDPNTALIVVGFGFNDYHLSQPILSAIRSNIGLRALLVGPSIDQSTQAVPQTARKLIAEGDWRLFLLNATFEEFVRVLPDVGGDTGEEKHRERLRIAERA